MSEKADPYFEQRLETARHHRVLRSIEINITPQSKVESNKEIPNPILEGTIEEFGWSEKSVENIIDALENGRIGVVFLGPDRIRVEFYPIKGLPELLGHVSELDTVRQNMKSGTVFGPSQHEQFTYLQNTDFAVEGYMDDESEGKEYGRVYVSSQKLSDKRNIYLDPESLHITDYEYGYSYCVKGGVPFEAIVRIDVIKAKKLPLKERDTQIDTTDWSDDPEAHMGQLALRLKEYLKTKVGVR